MDGLYENRYVRYLSQKQESLHIYISEESIISNSRHTANAAAVEGDGVASGDGDGKGEGEGSFWEFSCKKP